MTQESLEKPADSISTPLGGEEQADQKNAQEATAANPGGMSPENGGRDQAGRFLPGRSGNPAGKPKGARNWSTRVLEQLLEDEAEGLMTKAVELAKSGDMAALRLCLERILPPRKDRPVAFELPAITTAADAKEASAALLSAVAAGSLTPSEASEVGKLVEAYLKAIETTEILARIERLEKGQRA